VHVCLMRTCVSADDEVDNDDSDSDDGSSSGSSTTSATHRVREAGGVCVCSVTSVRVIGRGFCT
jgi:hypothetical protein